MIIISLIISIIHGIKFNDNEIDDDEYHYGSHSGSGYHNGHDNRSQYEYHYLY